MTLKSDIGGWLGFNDPKWGYPLSFFLLLLSSFVPLAVSVRMRQLIKQQCHHSRTFVPWLSLRNWSLSLLSECSVERVPLFSERCLLRCGQLTNWWALPRRVLSALCLLILSGRVCCWPDDWVSEESNDSAHQIAHQNVLPKVVVVKERTGAQQKGDDHQWQLTKGTGKCGQLRKVMLQIAQQVHSTESNWWGSTREETASSKDIRVFTGGTLKVLNVQIWCEQTLRL